MSTRESQRTGRLRLRHLMEVTEAVGERMGEQRSRFEGLADPASAPRAVSSFNLFQTPPDLAARLMSLFPQIGRALEPSAGLGRLYRAVRAVSSSPMVLVEVAPQCCRELYEVTAGDPAASLVHADFLTCTPERLGLFDSIVMNPPFKMGLDARHIRHAVRFLAPGGRLVSLVAASSRKRESLADLLTEWIDLPAGTFKGEATNVETAIVVADA